MKERSPKFAPALSKLNAQLHLPEWLFDDQNLQTESFLIFEI